MPAVTVCRFCGRTGFVRYETVITKEHAFRHYYCGACNRTWDIDESQPAPPREPRRKRPMKRSR